MKSKVALITLIAIGAVLFLFASDRHTSTTNVVAAAAFKGVQPAASERTMLEALPENFDGNDPENPDQQQPGGSLDEKLAALKELRDSGAIPEDEYQAKVSALQGGSSAPATLPGSGAMRTVQIDDPQLQM